MTEAESLLAKARGEIGTKEIPANSNNVKYNTAYYNREVNGSDYLWCCVFIWWLFSECGLSTLYYGGGKTASCTTLMNYYKGKGQFSKTPKVGSLVFYNWGSGSIAKHIGIVTEVGDGYIKAIEGNTGVGDDSNGGEVMERTRKISQILGYAYPYEGGSKVTVSVSVLQSGSKGYSVKALQILLNGYGHNCGTVDGSFGPVTLAAVKSFQKEKGLAVDGSVGPATWTALLGG